MKTTITARQIDAVAFPKGNLRKYEGSATRYLGSTGGAVDAHTNLNEDGEVTNAVFIWGIIGHETSVKARLDANDGVVAITRHINDEDARTTVFDYLTTEDARTLRDALNEMDLDA